MQTANRKPQTANRKGMFFLGSITILLVLLSCQNDRTNLNANQNLILNFQQTDQDFIYSLGIMHNQALSDYLNLNDTTIAVDEFVRNWLFNNSNFDPEALESLSEINITNFYEIDDIYEFVNNCVATRFVIDKTIECLNISNSENDYSNMLVMYHDLYQQVVESSVSDEEKFAVCVPISIGISSLEYWDKKIVHYPGLTWNEIKKVAQEDLEGATWAVMLGYTAAFIKSAGNPKVFLAIIAAEATLGAVQASIQAVLKLPKK